METTILTLGTKTVNIFNAKCISANRAEHVSGGTKVYQI